MNGAIQAITEEIIPFWKQFSYKNQIPDATRLSIHSLKRASNTFLTNIVKMDVKTIKRQAGWKLESSSDNIALRYDETQEIASRAISLAYNQWVNDKFKKSFQDKPKSKAPIVIKEQITMNPLQYFEDDFEIDLDDEELFKKTINTPKSKR